MWGDSQSWWFSMSHYICKYIYIDPKKKETLFDMQCMGRVSVCVLPSEIYKAIVVYKRKQ